MSTEQIRTINADGGGTSRRTRSIWLNQLVLAASVVAVAVVILAIDTSAFRSATFAIGITVIVVTTAVTMALPWSRLPRLVVLVIPFVDILGVGAISFGNDMRLGFLWSFPVIWIAMYFSTAALLGSLMLILGILLVSMSFEATTTSLIRFSVILIGTIFIGITTHIAAQQNTAFRRLLRRQALRLRRASARAEADERRTTELLNAVDIGIARIGRGGEFLVVNDTLAALYGIDRDDLAQPPKSIDYDDRVGFPVPERDRPLARAARGEEFEEARVWLFDTSGEWRALAVSSKRLDPVDADAGILLIARDVTTIVSAQRDREQLNAMATHEMRHPLTAILGNAELSLDLDELPPKARQRMEVIHSSSERLVSLVSDFLAGGRTAKAPSEAGESHFDLRAIVRQSVESFAAAAAAADISVEAYLGEEMPVVADSFRVRQVIDNLVSNAIKYTRDGGRVTVRGRREGKQVLVSVTDTGIGMSPGDLRRVFDPYFRAEAAKEKAPGTGLGMSISREILQSHGGYLSVESRSGIGTVATAELPAAV